MGQKANMQTKHLQKQFSFTFEVNTLNEVVPFLFFGLDFDHALT